jgi:hypothetical protein
MVGGGFLFATWRLPRVWRHSSVRGSPDMVCPLTSLQTEAGSLRQASGAASASGWECLTSQQQLTTPCPMVWWSVYTGKLRMPSAPAWPESSGLNTSLGAPRPPRGSKGGLRHLFSGAGVWGCPHPYWAVPCSNGAVACPTTSSSSSLQHLFLRDRLHMRRPRSQFRRS